MKTVSIFILTLVMFFSLTSATNSKAIKADAKKSAFTPPPSLYAEMYFDNEYYDSSGNIYEDVNIKVSTTYSTYTPANVSNMLVNYWIDEYDEIDEYEVGYTYPSQYVSGSDITLVSGALIDDGTNSYTYNLIDGPAYYAEPFNTF
jgi:hypothetical protein